MVISQIRYIHASHDFGDVVSRKNEVKKLIRVSPCDKDKYFLILDEDAIMLMHPIHSELERHNKSSLKDVKGSLLYADMVKCPRTRPKKFTNIFSRVHW